jgi:hypothetical protein
MSNPSPEEVNPRTTNWSKARDHIDTVQDPVVCSLLRLVYVHFIHDGLEGIRPNDFDLLYCVQLLDRAFSFKESFGSALAAKYEG